jgi:RNA polymerase sigma-70 factor (ECF subfamily)
LSCRSRKRPKSHKGNSSLATYLAVIARRICVHELARRSAAQEVQHRDGKPIEVEEPPKAEIGLESLEEVEKILGKLPSRDREVVRLYYLEGRSYVEISTELNIPVNSIGPILSRARKKLRKDVKKRDTQATGATGVREETIIPAGISEPPDPNYLPPHEPPVE